MAPTLGPTPSRPLILLLAAGGDTPSAAAALTMLPLDAVLTNTAIPDTVFHRKRRARSGRLRVN
jgi:hypothetical protein